MVCFHMNLLRLRQLTFRLIQVRQAQSRFRSRESSVQAASKTKEEQFPRITFHKKPLRVLIRTSTSEKSPSGKLRHLGFLSCCVVCYTEMCIQGSDVGRAVVDGIKSHKRRSVSKGIYSSGVACAH